MLSGLELLLGLRKIAQWVSNMPQRDYYSQSRCKDRISRFHKNALVLQTIKTLMVAHTNRSVDWNLITDFEESLDSELESTWSNLVRSYGSDFAVFQSAEWFRILLKDRAEKLAIAVGRDHSGRIVSVCPLELTEIDHSVYSFGRCLLKFKMPVASVLGGKPLGDEGGGDGIRSLRVLIQSQWKCVQALRMSIDTADSSLAESFKDMIARRTSLSLFATPSLPFHKLKLEGSFQEHMKRHSSKRRYNSRRELRILEQALGPSRLIMVRSPDELATATNQVESLRAKASEEDREFCSLVIGHFSSVARLTAEAGLQYTALLVSGNRLVAMIWGLRYRNEVHIRSLLTNPSYRSLSSGSVANYLFLQQVMNEKAGENIGCVVYGYGDVNSDHHKLNSITVHTDLLIHRSPKLFVLEKTRNLLLRATTVVKECLRICRKLLVKRTVETAAAT
jgi:CelD/BcsL family acetyltransferase involved in cellulose biosynthesis